MAKDDDNVYLESIPSPHENSNNGQRDCLSSEAADSRAMDSSPIGGDADIKVIDLRVASRDPSSISEDTHLTATDVFTLQLVRLVHGLITRMNAASA